MTNRPEGWIYRREQIMRTKSYTDIRNETYMVDGPVVQERGGNDLLDDLFQDLPPQILGRDLLRVLGRDNDSVDPKRDGRAAVLLVLHGDLGLGVRPEPRENAVAARGREGSVELMGEHDREGHALRRLIGRVSKHDALVSRTVVLERAVVEALRDVWALLLDGDEDVARLVVEALLRRVIPDLLDGVADDLLVVEPRLGGDLAKDHDHARL